MTDTNHPLAELHERLLDKLRQGEWEEASASAGIYLAATEQMIQAWQQAVVADEKEALARQLKEIHHNQAEIIGRLRARLYGLEERMVSLQKGKSGCQHYAAQTPAHRR